MLKRLVRFFTTVGKFYAVKGGICPVINLAIMEKISRILDLLIRPKDSAIGSRLQSLEGGAASEG